MLQSHEPKGYHHFLQSRNNNIFKSLYFVFKTCDYINYFEFSFENTTLKSLRNKFSVLGGRRTQFFECWADDFWFLFRDHVFGEFWDQQKKKFGDLFQVWRTIDCATQEISSRNNILDISIFWSQFFGIAVIHPTLNFDHEGILHYLPFGVV